MSNPVPAPATCFSNEKSPATPPKIYICMKWTIVDGEWQQRPFVVMHTGQHLIDIPLRNEAKANVS